jgi:ferredoxin
MNEPDPVDRLIIPPEQALRITGSAEHIYLRQCSCRVQEQRCPPETWEVCLLFDGSPQEDIQKARPITRDEATAVVHAMTQRDSIFNLFYTHSGRAITELCCCCTCCCRPLHRMKAAGNYAEQMRSGYVAVTDDSRCIACGTCEASCYFEARRVIDDRSQLVDENCFGCGMCLPSCPEQAIRLEWQAGRGVAIPVQNAY